MPGLDSLRESSLTQPMVKSCTLQKEAEGCHTQLLSLPCLQEEHAPHTQRHHLPKSQTESAQWHLTNCTGDTDTSLRPSANTGGFSPSLFFWHFLMSTLHSREKYAMLLRKQSIFNFFSRRCNQQVTSPENCTLNKMTRIDN